MPTIKFNYGNMQGNNFKAVYSNSVDLSKSTDTQSTSTAPYAKAHLAENIISSQRRFSPPPSEGSESSGSRKSSVMTAGIFGPGMKRLGSEDGSRLEPELPLATHLRRTKSAPAPRIEGNAVAAFPLIKKAQDISTDRFASKLVLFGKTAGAEIFHEAKKQVKGKSFNETVYEIYKLAPREAISILDALRARYERQSDQKLDHGNAKIKMKEIFSDPKISTKAKELFVKALAAGSNAWGKGTQGQSEIEVCLRKIGKHQDLFR